MNKKENQTKKETVKKDKKVTLKKATVKKETKKQPKKKQELFLVSVKKEMGKVRWPLKKELFKYSIATLSFIIFFALFFALGDLLIAAVKVWVA